MTDREIQIVRMLLSYCISNLDDIKEAFVSDEDGKLDYNGELIDPPTEDELAYLLKIFPG